MLQTLNYESYAISNCSFMPTRNFEKSQSLTFEALAWFYKQVKIFQYKFSSRQWQVLESEDRGDIPAKTV